MTTPRLIRPLVSLGLIGIAALLVFGAATPPALAGTVKGTVRLPDPARVGRMHQGYWRLENGNVPVRAAAGKATAAVILEGISGMKGPPAKTVTVEIGGLDANPKVVVVGPGSVVEFKNVGKVTHELSTPADVSFMPIERLNPGTYRHQKFGLPGGYLVRCSDYPHLAISVIVADSPNFSLVDDRGGFQIPGTVPDGKATLKVWSMGRWVHEESIDTSGKQELTIRVAPSGKAPKEPEVKDPETEGKESEAKTE